MGLVLFFEFTTELAVPGVGNFGQTLHHSEEDRGATYPDENPTDAFVAKLNPSGTAILWATYLRGSGPNQATKAQKRVYAPSTARRQS